MAQDSLKLPAPPAEEKSFGGRVFCHSAHTHGPQRGARTTFSGGEARAPKPGAKTPTENKQSRKTKETERPHVGSPRAKPNQETRKTGEPEFRVTAEGKEPPNSLETLLNLVEEEHREVEERHHEHAIPKRAKRNNRK